MRSSIALPQPHAQRMTSLRKVCALLAVERGVLGAASVGVAGTPEHTRQAALPGIGPVRIR